MVSDSHAQSVRLGPGSLRGIHKYLRQTSQKSRLRVQKTQDEDRPHLTWGVGGGGGGQADVGKKGWEQCLGMKKKKNENRKLQVI